MMILLPQGGRVQNLGKPDDIILEHSLMGKNAVILTKEFCNSEKFWRAASVSFLMSAYVMICTHISFFGGWGGGITSICDASHAHVEHTNLKYYTPRLFAQFFYFFHSQSNTNMLEFIFFQKLGKNENKDWATIFMIL